MTWIDYACGAVVIINSWYLAILVIRAQREVRRLRRNQLLQDESYNLAWKLLLTDRKNRNGNHRGGGNAA